MQPDGDSLWATRASPPGLASSEPERRATYAAALQQFDDLMDAAAAVGPVSRPLPLYYAVHQAGKAIAAAWVKDDWRVRGHGLTEHKRDRTEWETNVLRYRVRPQKDQPGVFGAVASTVGVTRLTSSVEVGALWSALPGVIQPTSDRSWPLALPIYPISYDDAGHPSWVCVGLRGQLLENADEGNDLLAIYPDVVGARTTTYQGKLQVMSTPWGSASLCDCQTPKSKSGPRNLLLAFRSGRTFV